MRLSFLPILFYADNTLLNSGSGGDTVRDLARQSGSVKTQVVQLDLGGSSANAESLITAGQQLMANSVPTTLASDQSPLRSQQTLNIPPPFYLMTEGQSINSGQTNVGAYISYSGAGRAPINSLNDSMASQYLLYVIPGKIVYVEDIVIVSDGPIGVSFTILEGGYGTTANTMTSAINIDFMPADGGRATIPIKRYFREQGSITVVVTPNTLSGTRPSFGIHATGFQFTNDLNFNSKKALLVCGDSITWGNMGADLQGRQFIGNNLYTFTLRDQINKYFIANSIASSLRVIEKGFGGSTAVDWAQAIDNGYINGIEYDLMVVALGTNDAGNNSVLLGTGTLTATAASTAITFSSSQSFTVGQRISSNGSYIGAFASGSGTSWALAANSPVSIAALAFYTNPATSTKVTGTVQVNVSTAAAQTITITGVGTAFNTQLAVGNVLAVNGVYIGAIAAITNATSLTVTSTTAYMAMPSGSTAYFSIYSTNNNVANLSQFDYYIKKFILFRNNHLSARVRNASIILNGAATTDSTTRVATVADYRTTMSNVANDSIIGTTANKVYFYDQSTAFGLNATPASDTNFNNGTTGGGSTERLLGQRLHLSGYGHNYIAYGTTGYATTVTSSTVSTTVTFSQPTTLASGTVLYAVISGVHTLIGTLSGAITNATTGTLTGNASANATTAPMGLWGIVQQSDFITNSANLVKVL